MSYGYDAEGRRSGLSVQQDATHTATTTYGYDPLGRLQTVTSGAGTFTYGYVGNTGLLNSLAMPNGVTSTYGYTPLQQLKSVVNKDASNTLISSYAYSYGDPATGNDTGRGIRTAMQSQVGSDAVQTVDYGYDQTNQLTSETSREATPQVNNAYAYDAMGNRTRTTRQAGQSNGSDLSYVPNKLNQLLSYSGTSAGTAVAAQLSYDPMGNMTGLASSYAGQPSGNTSYTYDEANRLTMVVVSDAQGAATNKSEFVYDGLSRKVASRDYLWQNGAWQLTKEVRRVYDGMDVVQERNENNQVTAQLTRDGGLVLGVGGLLSRRVWDENGQARTCFYAYDGSGNVIQMTDTTGQVVAKYAYDAFGVLRSSDGALKDLNPYRYSTKEWHANTGLYDYGYRFYSPGLGRWINRDPIAEVGGLNLYEFVFNAPTNYADIYGNSAAAVLPIAAPIAIADGPLPVGDVVAGVIIVGAVCYAWFNRPRITQGKSGKGREAFEQHQRVVEEAQEELQRLQEQLRRTKSHWDKKEVEEAIEKVKDVIRGHQKEIKQKWPKGCPNE